MPARVSPSPHRARRARLAATALLPLLAGCVDYTTGLPAAGSNTPVVGQAPGAFGFDVVARGWTADESYALGIDTPTITVGLTITGYRAGTGTLAVTGADGRVVFTRSLAGNVAQGSTAATGQPPFTAHLRATGYTGIIALGIAEGGE